MCRVKASLNTSHCCCTRNCKIEYECQPHAKADYLQKQILSMHDKIEKALGDKITSVTFAGVPPKPPPKVAPKRPTMASRQAGRGRGSRSMKLGAQKLTPKAEDSDVSEYL